MKSPHKVSLPLSHSHHSLGGPKELLHTEPFQGLKLGPYSNLSFIGEPREAEQFPQEHTVGKQKNPHHDPKLSLNSRPFSDVTEGDLGWEWAWGLTSHGHRI